MYGSPFDLPVDLPNGAHDLTKNQSRYATFLPSISAIYARIVSMEKYTMRDSLPEGMIRGLDDLNFLDPLNHLFYYPAALYSAGHAELDPATSYTAERMVQQRDRTKTVMVGDSGGFQAATGVLKYPWFQTANQTAAEHIKDQDDFRMKILRWLEATSDYSMVLDWPTYGLVKYGFDPVTNQSLHPGLKSFADCLNGSLENHKFFIKNRVEGATKFLNVLQGRNQEEGDIWWEAAKDLPFETWAFSNVQASNFNINLRRLLIMRDTGYLEGREWLHYLGNGKIKAGCALTTVQQVLRKRVDPNLTVSFDAASPFVMVAKAQIYYGYEMNHSKVGFKGGSLVDDKALKGSKQFFNDWIAANCKNINPRPSSIGSRVTVGDICVRGYEDLEYKKVAWTKKELESDAYKNSIEAAHNDKFRWSQAYKDYLTHGQGDSIFDWGDGARFEKETEKYQVKWPSSLDGFSYILAMNHNVELHINAIQAACYYQEQPIEIASQYLTSDLLEFRDLCDEIFTTETPMDLLVKHERMLQNITGMDADNAILLDLEQD